MSRATYLQPIPQPEQRLIRARKPLQSKRETSWIHLLFLIGDFAGQRGCPSMVPHTIASQPNPANPLCKERKSCGERDGRCRYGDHLQFDRLAMRLVRVLRSLSPSSENSARWNMARANREDGYAAPRRVI